MNSDPVLSPRSRYALPTCIPKAPGWLLFLLVSLSCGLFLAQSLAISGTLGFALDDAWIHMRYADNLAHGFGFSYNRGVLSPGSTAPLWVLLLAATRWWELPPVVSAHVLGVVLFGLSCWLTRSLALQLGCRPASALLAGVLTAVTARLVWGAVSGMEVSLYVSLAVLAVSWHIRFGLDSGWRSYLATIVFALVVHARPEGYVLFPLAWLSHWWVARDRPLSVLRAFLPHLAVYLAVLSPQWAFNMAIIGSIFPATFHAKVQGGLIEALHSGNAAEIIRSVTIQPVEFIGLYARFWLENNAVLFLPMLLGATRLIRQPLPGQSSRTVIVPLILLLTPLAIGVVSGQNGLVARYIAFLVPCYIVSAVVGLEEVNRQLVELKWFGHALRRAVRCALVALAVSNAALVLTYASQRYGWMVDNIKEMQVFMGHWVNQNIPEDALIAINDVGAITYFGNREIIDTVGLTTPEIIPYLRDRDHSRDDNVLRYLRLRRPDYLIVFPNWYPELTRRSDFFESVFTHTYTRKNVTLGGVTTVVFRCRWEAE